MGLKYDNKIFGIIGSIADCFFAGVLWIIACIPIFTIGASSAALYYTIYKVVFNKEGYVFSTFKQTFKDNFKSATIKWLICLCLDIFLVVDIIIGRIALKQNSILGVAYYFFIVILLVAVAWQIVLFSYEARFQDSIKDSMVKSFVLAIGNAGWMLLIEAVLYVVVIICNGMQSLFLILPGLFCCLIHFVMERIFKKIVEGKE